MVRGIRAAVLFLSLLVAGQALAAPGDKERARDLLTRGDQLYKQGKYEAALEAYNEAYMAFPSPKIFYPIAQAEEKLGRTMEALVHYEQLLTEAGDDLNDDVRARAEARITELEKQIAVVTFDVRPEGTWVVIDDVEMGRAPLGEPVRLPPGEHAYAFRKSGFQTVEKTVTLAPGDRIHEVVELLPADARPAAPPAVTEPTEPAPSGPRTRVVAGVLTTTTLAVGALACGLWATSEHDRYVDEGVSIGERRDARSRGRTLSRITDGLWVGAAVAAGLTAYWYYDRKPESGQASTSFHPALGPEGAGFVVSGEF